MADTPDVLKRLEEIEDRNRGECDPVCPTMDVRYLLRLARALLESQGELISGVRRVCHHTVAFGLRRGCPTCDLIVRAERVRKGEV